MANKIKELAQKAGFHWKVSPLHYTNTSNPIDFPVSPNAELERFAELIVAEMTGLMDQTIEDIYAMDPSERSVSYIETLQHWIDTFNRHFSR